ncbi:MAG: gas vesicle protein [Microcystis sp.]|jgi:peptidoglycan hydrolase CwlO-like protein|uniref:gas vesicle protein n=1 Tax=unclassified Microcystis TaxID=2643300 RepID=UPI001D3DAD3C|nr:gas vesicle protein [Microcystis sp. M112S1]MCA2683991.1 gas vesicle protein [Microcystis sp. M046S2]MCA2704564.1 gas vesicle protein [Microcystis sp. M038S2]MCA2948139.1 gas vesicle protein [Microcystis sp. M109S1]NCR58236.1 gas vesicle protein [Microcystis aeruginosa LL13-06]NCS01915.1 gas vesicle protein [Microcystis aeruginosa G13-11]NCS06523.1 gas vesicle protein [Microcystis aeruginosa G13-07]NCS15135.1 gas vesicle protein [Microcystis aeruginosa G13-12]NCS18910.1 gas vesicle prote
MTTTRSPRSIRSKISTMPRKQSEADQQLELYKLITEKQRIQEKLEIMERQIQQLKSRLTFVTDQIETTEQSIQNLRTVNPPSLAKKPDSPKTVAHSSNNSSNFQAFYLEY